MGYTSTAIYESLAFNLKTYIYKDKLSELYMEDLCEMNYAEYFTNAEELALKIKNKKSKDIIDKEFCKETNKKGLDINVYTFILFCFQNTEICRIKIIRLFSKQFVIKD